MIRRRTSHIVLSAGGTGGHMFPALALMEELLERGHKVSLITDKRGLAYHKIFKGIKIYQVGSASFTGKGFIGKILSILRISPGDTLYCFPTAFKTAYMIRRAIYICLLLCQLPKMP